MVKFPSISVPSFGKGSAFSPLDVRRKLSHLFVPPLSLGKTVSYPVRLLLVELTRASVLCSLKYERVISAVYCNGGDGKVETFSPV